MKKIINWSFPIIIVLLLLIVIGMYLAKKNTPTNINNGNKITVTTSFYPLYFFATQIGKDKVSIKNITPSGAEPHDYEPTAQEMALIENSSLLILNGAHLEAWGDKVQNELKGTNEMIVVAGEGLTNQQIDEDGQKIQDPHVWLSPPLAKKEVERILGGLIKVDPNNKNYYESNAKELKAKLDALDQEYKQGFMNCKQKDIITSHAAFGYLATAYGLTQIPIAGLSPDEEPSIKKLAETAQFAKEHNVHYIFFESLVSPKLSETIATEVGAQTMVLDPIEGIADGEMKQGKNYLTVMQDNLKNLRVALECK